MLDKVGAILHMLGTSEHVKDIQMHGGEQKPFVTFWGGFKAFIIYTPRINAKFQVGYSSCS